MIEAKDDALVFSSPEVHEDARCTVVFQRTLRIPEEGKEYPVPPGLGRYRLDPVSKCGATSPDSWDENGMFFPMYQSEALWIIFIGWYPFAVKVSVGGVNALTGVKLHDERLWRPRDYAVVPGRPWMEWFCVGNGRARQFTAMPLGRGSTNGNGAHATEITITAHPMNAEKYGEYRSKRAKIMSAAGLFERTWIGGGKDRADEKGSDMGPGAWEASAGSTCSVYPVNSLTYLRVTGDLPAGKAPSRAEYVEAGLPWMEHYGADGKAIAACRQRVS